ncbi:MAG: helix-turn-helix domain-containing protein [Spirochaetales bacterium]|nr:helix-turn-helix domain-containing protein [Spirochaetales bacterium]
MKQTLSREQREKILLYGREHGISEACRKFSVSRTIYYRWKKRFENEGHEGLKDRIRNFVPVNKIKQEIEERLFEKVAEHPDYGPLSLKWLLEDEHIYISASGVYNILVRHGLNKRPEREKFARRYRKTRPIPRGFEPRHGELWLCWTDIRKNLMEDKILYQYSILDVSSGVSCSRLYNDNDTAHALDLLVGLAVPMGKELLMKPATIITPDDRIYRSVKSKEKHPYMNTLKQMGVTQLKWDIDFKDFKELSEDFSTRSLEYLISNSTDAGSVNDLRSLLQDFLREFNLKTALTCGPGKGSTPLDNVRRISDQKITLPLWAYLDRKY